MLMSVISSSVYRNASSVGIVSISTVPGIPKYENVIIIILIVLLIVKDVYSSSKKLDRITNDAFNMAIIPLCYNFMGFVIFKIVEFIK